MTTLRSATGSENFTNSWLRFLTKKPFSLPPLSTWDLIKNQIVSHLLAGKPQGVRFVSISFMEIAEVSRIVFHSNIC